MQATKSNEIDLSIFLKQKRDKIPVLEISRKTEYLSVIQYAKLLGKHPITIYKWLEEDRIDGAVKLGRCWRIPITREVEPFQEHTEQEENEWIEYVVMNLKNHIRGIKRRGKSFIGRDFCIEYISGFLGGSYVEADTIIEQRIKPFLKSEGMKYGKD